MSRITLVDNKQKQIFLLNEYKKDCENLRVIGNKTIEELQAESNILLFPPKVEDTDDRIKKSVIFNLKESEDSFSIDTGNIMGFIGRNDTELSVFSRFTHKDSADSSKKDDYFLHYMLEKVCHVNLSSLKSTNISDKVFDFIPFLFPQYLIAALKQGLYKEYQTHDYNNSNVRGVIDINRHIRLNIPSNGKVAYKVREYSYDNSITELVRHTIEYMRGSSIFKTILLQNEEIRTAVSQIDCATPLYNRADRNKIISKTSKLLSSPYYNRYRDLQKICRMILLREKIKYGASSNKIFGILFDGAWLWEEYLATILKTKGFVHPENKKKTGSIQPFVQQIGKFYPDFYKRKANKRKANPTMVDVILDDHNPQEDMILDDHNSQEDMILDDYNPQEDMILDAKYKEFDVKNPQADDIAQMIAYLHVMNARRGSFIYPSKDSSKIENCWTVKPFSGTFATISAVPFYIPQDKDNYKEFKKKIEESETALITKILSFAN